MTPVRRRIAVFKFASCDGCQLSLLDCEEELLGLASKVEFANFAEMSSATTPGRYDLALIEGSITTEEDALRIAEIRERADLLVTIGACATSGGLQALRNLAAPGEYAALVYAHPEFLRSLDTSTPISAHVAVDYELHGCPIDRHQLLEVITALLGGRRPVVPDGSTCQECKARGIACLVVRDGRACLGPVTRSGCGALCPSVDRPCFGCFGPAPGTNPAGLARHYRAEGHDRDGLVRLLSGVNVAAPAFRHAAEEVARDPRP